VFLDGKKILPLIQKNVEKINMAIEKELEKNRPFNHY